MSSTCEEFNFVAGMTRRLVSAKRLIISFRIPTNSLSIALKVPFAKSKYVQKLKYAERKRNYKSKDRFQKFAFKVFLRSLAVSKQFERANKAAKP